MATTMFFEQTIRDKEDTSIEFDLEFGRSSAYDGENLIYLVIDGKTIVLDDATGRKLCEGMAGLAGYLGYDR